MSVITTWVCDGCDDKLNWKPSMATDWKVYGVTLTGARGYPICADEDVVQREFHLCPHCARRLFDQADPKHWARVQQTKAD